MEAIDKGCKVTFIHHRVLRSFEEVCAEWQVFQVVEAVSWRLFSAIYLGIFIFAEVELADYSTLTIALHPMQSIIDRRTSRLMSNNDSKQISWNFIFNTEAA
jgi:hypothetical protein